MEKLERVLGELDTTGNGTNYTNVWKELRKAYPKNTHVLLTGVKNYKGKLITNPNEKKSVLLDHFQHRMRKQGVKDEIREIEKVNNELFEKRLIETKKLRFLPLI